jgi:acetoin:2,6-dichlorophenolindophenol oxidoreductase subunit alpha
MPNLEPAGGEQPSAQILRRMLTTMELIHRCDQRTAADVQKGQLRAAYYPVRGLEAVCAAMGEAARPSDALVSTYRNLADVIAKGADLRSVVAELYGRATGTSKGKGGPMHLADVSVGLMATTGIVGGGLPIAAGLALAKKLDGRGEVCFTTFGDGATSIGAFHEALNFAALWKLPLVLICQNNQWGEHTAYRDYAPVESVSDRAAAYGMPAIRVDGFDPVACWQAMTAATHRARTGGGPTLCEFVTYRLMPHSAAGDASYVPTDELAAALRREPLPNFRRWLAETGQLSEAELTEVQEQATVLVEDAFEFALASPPPDSAERLTDVYGETLSMDVIA